MMNSLLKATAAILMMAAGSTVSLAPAFAQEAPRWAVDACTNEVAKYGVSVTEITDVITGKGGATLTMNGYNSASVPVTFVCTYTIDTNEVMIEYQ
ncbi:hypothetical protein ACN4EK_01505 [Pantanalinema rosaneae CENA516]|uniref:hypothetical protein n=1 Tax=Pantanalinema rosaneae TaxID=1620701 RepID=UPI003D6DB8D6